MNSSPDSPLVQRPDAVPEGDYVAPGLQMIMPDLCFPNMIQGDRAASPWPWLRRTVQHNWYVDRRAPIVGFLSRDEAHILYNSALMFAGKPALEIGCFMGWSTCHLALAGVNLDVIDPQLGDPGLRESVRLSLGMAGVLDRVNLMPGTSPTKVEMLAEALGKRWNLIFIDGDHEAPGPRLDAEVCARYAADDAMVLFHDLAAPAVADGMDYFRDAGWNVKIYNTMQVMGVAWRGNVTPVRHKPDPAIRWDKPMWVRGYPSDLDD